MRMIINFVLTLVIFMLADHFVPEYLSIVDTKTAVIAAILRVAVVMCLNILIVFSVLLIPVGVGCLTIIPVIIANILSTPLFLYFADKYMAGFEINGFWTYVVLTILLSLFTFGNAKED